MPEIDYKAPHQVFAEMAGLLPPPPEPRPVAVPWTAGEGGAVVTQDEPPPEPTLDELLAGINPICTWLDPQVEKMSPGSYRVPLRVARRFVAAAGSQASDLVLKGAGTPHALGFWPRLLDLARAAAAANRFTILGKLAYLADRSFAVQSLPPGTMGVAELKDAAAGSHLFVPLPPNDASGQSTAQQAMQALLAFFDYANRRIQPRPYVVSALSYLLSLPESFLPPADLISRQLRIVTADRAAAPRSAVGWTLLRQFWSTGYDAWKSHPDAIRKLAEAPNPFVRRLSQVIDAASIAPAPLSPFEPRFRGAAPDATWEEIEANADAPPAPRAANPSRGGWMQKMKQSVAAVVGRKRRPPPATPDPPVTEPLEFPKS